MSGENKGLENERNIIRRFNEWRDDTEVGGWLEALGINLPDVKFVQASKVKRDEENREVKPDVQLKVNSRGSDFLFKISIKYVSNPRRGSNHVDKRWVDDYASLWNIPANIALMLKEFTGESTGKGKRIYLNKRTVLEQQDLRNFFSHHKQKVVSDVLKGSAPNQAEWMMISHGPRNVHLIKPMKAALDHFGFGPVMITPRGGLRIGQIKVQCKGGDRGKPTANKLQFKIDPIELFSV